MMSTMLRRLAVAVFAGWVALAGAPSVSAQGTAAKKKKARQLYKQGTTQYNLGRWERAIELFQKSYEEYPSSALLFNIAQSYRQWGKCRRALFFYKRFLAVKPNASNRDEVEGFINDLEETCKKSEESIEKPPLDAMEPTDDGGTEGGGGSVEETGGTSGDRGGSGDGTRVAVKGEDGDERPEIKRGGTGPERPAGVTAGPPRPTKVASSVSLGTALVGMGDLDVPAQFSLGIGAGYPMTVGPIGLELGGLFTYTPVPWDNQAADPPQSGTASLTSLLANAAATYPVWDKLSARGELGLGVLFFSGADDAGSVFIEPGKMATGALTMFHLRVGLGAEYAITPNLVVSAHPLVFSYSPARSGLREDISSITRIEFLAGIGYKL